MPSRAARNATHDHEVLTDYHLVAENGGNLIDVTYLNQRSRKTLGRSSLVNTIAQNETRAVRGLLGISIILGQFVSLKGVGGATGFLGDVAGTYTAAEAIKLAGRREPLMANLNVDVVLSRARQDPNRYRIPYRLRTIGIDEEFGQRDITYGADSARSLPASALLDRSRGLYGYGQFENDEKKQMVNIDPGLLLYKMLAGLRSAKDQERFLTAIQPDLFDIDQSNRYLSAAARRPADAARNKIMQHNKLTMLSGCLAMAGTFLDINNDYLYPEALEYWSANRPDSDFDPGITDLIDRLGSRNDLVAYYEIQSASQFFAEQQAANAFYPEYVNYIAA